MGQILKQQHDEARASTATDDFSVVIRLPDVSVDEPRAAVSTSPAKRLLDITLSSIMLVVTSPVIAVVAAAIWLEDRGRVFYAQERWGSDRRLIRVLKFRTMIPDSDERFGVRQAMANDPRVTRVGKVLRACGLDELPQLVNILRGEMSFVGPRPLAFGELVYDTGGKVIAYEEMPGFAERLRTRPGLTGLATIYLPKDAPAAKKIEFDLRYIEEWSLRLDLKLILMSFLISFRGRWETRSSKI